MPLLAFQLAIVGLLEIHSVFLGSRRVKSGVLAFGTGVLSRSGLGDRMWINLL